jgi:uncharacterized protein (DUF952 family)
MSQASPNPEFIYKVATEESYGPSRAASSYAGMPVDAADGYMHFSTFDQLEETLSRHFRGQSDLVLLAIRTKDLAGDDLVWEPSRGGALFPHLYNRPLPLSVVAWEANISVDSEGNTVLPEAAR